MSRWYWSKWGKAVNGQVIGFDGSDYYIKSEWESECDAARRAWNAALEEAADRTERKAMAIKDSLNGQSSFYLQYDDQGHTSTKVRALMDMAIDIRSLKEGND